MYFLLTFLLLMMSILNFNLFIMFLMKKFSLLMNWNIYMNNFLMIKLLLYLDWMSLLFISTIFLISSMVILYSMKYMELENNINQFMMLIIIFITSMIMLIISMNMMTILLGWDGLGLSSYCLVIYYQNKKSYNSGMITILMNRIGDILILISISFMMKMNSWNFLFFKEINTMLMMLIFIAAITKSAQIPFSSWLPLAMAAPTPVSALVHSSTLVTAGIYLMIRFNYLFSKKLLLIMMLISSFTMIFSGISANFEYDLKKIIALSTLSQLGLMMMILSFKLPMLSFFHLITHAMFKSLLFLCSGIIIHNYFNNQDIRMISMNNLHSPFINTIMLIASLTLCGMPFISGFYSKDLIIEMFNMKMNNNFIFFFMYFSMMLTVSYSFRLMYYLNIKMNKIMNFNKINMLNLMNYSIMILIFMTIFFGTTLNWLMFNSLNFIYLPKSIKLLIYKFMIMGMILIFFLMKIKFFKKYFLKNLFKFFNLMFFLPLNFKKNKITMYKINMKMLLIKDYGWNEYILIKKMIFLLNSNKMNIKMNMFLLLSMMFLWMILFIMI